MKLCQDAQNKLGSGPSAQNNGHAMTWADVDSDPATFTSSSARLTIPDGARIAYAKLTWAGDTGEPADVPCGHGYPKPPGTPKQQTVSVTVGAKTTTVKPTRYTEDSLDEISHTDHQFYSAYADVTADFRGVAGPVTVTVGNVWTPQGFDCFGGWSLVAVWAFDAPQSKVAPARKQVTVYDAHARVLTVKNRAEVKVPSVRAAGGVTRVGIAGFEGDWALSGDQLLANGHNVGGSDNFFVASADGRLNPDNPNNMSVDARTVDVGPNVIRAGDKGANLAFTSGQDAYLVAGVAMSAARPELFLYTTMEQTAAHPGDQVTQTVVVTNTGGAPAADVQVHEDLGPGCDQTVGQLPAGQSAKVSCTRPAPDDDKKPTASVTGRSLAGDTLTASGVTFLEVIRPAIAVTKSASPDTVLSGQKVGYSIGVRNSGDTMLSNVTIDDKQVDACDKSDIGALPAGESKTVQCTVVAGDTGFTNTVTANGTDKIGLKVTSDAHAAFTVINPRVEFTVKPSTRAARPGETVTFTVTVTNPTTVPLGAVRVSGTPAVCARDIGDLAPKQSVVYTCSVTMTDRLVTALSVTATPVVDGQLVETRRNTVVQTVAVTVSLVPPVVEPPVVKKSSAVPPAPPIATAVFIAGLAAITTFVTVGAISSAARTRK